MPSVNPYWSIESIVCNYLTLSLSNIPISFS